MNMNQLKLAWETNRDATIAAVTFWSFWAINALTTALFGFENLGALFAPLLGVFPFAPSTVATLASLCGAIAALMMLDVAYRLWNSIRLNGAETSQQMNWALAAERGAFYISLTYTALEMVMLVWGHLLPPVWKTILEIYGAVSFVGMTIFHLMAGRQYLTYAPRTQEAQVVATIRGRATTERLAQLESMANEALRQAKPNIEQGVAEITATLSQSLTREVLGYMMVNAATAPRQIAAPAPAVTAAPDPEPEPMPVPTVTAIPRPAAAYVNGNGVHHTEGNA